MAAAALLSITLVPALMVIFVRGRIIPEHKNPLNRFLIWIYRPVIKGVMRAKVLVILLAVGVLAISIWPARQLGTEFMPNLNEGTLLYMPTTLPGISVTKAAELMQTQDRIIRSFPEVASVFGKAGRATTATDPAPMEMFETVVNLKPKEQWRPGVTIDSLIAEMDKALQFPGVSNAWTMPIKARIDMLSTGIRTPVGVKVIGTDLAGIDKLARQIEQVLKAVPGTSSAYAARALGGYYLEIEPNREALSRYGIMVRDVQDTIATALGGQSVTSTVEGRQRFTVNMRYPRGLRDNPKAIASDILVPMPGGGAVPLGEVASVTPARGPTSIRTENGQLATYIYVDIRDRDLGGYVADAQRAVQASIQFPAGYYLVWSGQYEYLERATARLKVVVPVTLLIIFLLLYLNFRSITETMIVMLIYLNQAWAEVKVLRQAQDRPVSRRDLYDAIMAGAVERVRPKMMTVVAIMAGLLPIMWSTGTGSEIMQRIAVPMIGGMISSTLLTLFVIPAIFGLVKGFRLKDGDSHQPSARAGRAEHVLAPEPVE
jgi:Cu(I)/Ag(I) efflux system membrane protein CusA/SilA